VAGIPSARSQLGQPTASAASVWGYRLGLSAGVIGWGYCLGLLAGVVG
jgi:hypothetical protein